MKLETIRIIRSNIAISANKDMSLAEFINNYVSASSKATPLCSLGILVESNEFNYSLIVRSSKASRDRVIRLINSKSPTITYQTLVNDLLVTKIK